MPLLPKENGANAGLSSILEADAKKIVNMARATFGQADIGVFLSNATNVVEATIKSLEIIKLIPFTPNELRLAAEKNNPLTREVEAALENKPHMVCFMKYYDRAYRGNMKRRYPVMKIYIEAEVEEYNEAQQEVRMLIPLQPILTHWNTLDLHHQCHRFLLRKNSLHLQQKQYSTRCLESLLFMNRDLMKHPELNGCWPSHKVDLLKK